MDDGATRKGIEGQDRLCGLQGMDGCFSVARLASDACRVRRKSDGIPCRDPRSHPRRARPDG